MQLINEQEWQALPESAQQEIYDFFKVIKQRYNGGKGYFCGDVIVKKLRL
jgi:hypothetical protein